MQHRRLSNIDKLEFKGVEAIDQEGFKREIISFYQNLYAETETWRLNFQAHESPIILEKKQNWLRSTFEETRSAR